MAKVAINGFGRMGRLGLRAAWGAPDIELVHINETGGDVESAAHLLTFDSNQGTWSTPVEVAAGDLVIEGQRLSYSQNADIAATPWRELGVDVVVDCTGQFKSAATLQPFFDASVRKVVVSAPVKEDALNVVMGVNEHLYDVQSHDIVTASSCTTNCLAPLVEVIHAQFGIRHGSFTTIHDITNTQSVLDQFQPDLRRARASGQSLIPTTTGCAKAIGDIFPELRGKLTGLAVRVPVANASITDCAFVVDKPVNAEIVNQALEEAASGALAGILGFERRPLVSSDYRGDPRSSIVDALSTVVVADHHVKLLAWYDNEFGYANRLMELTRLVARSL